MIVPEEDRMDFAIWEPLEFLLENENKYSLRWSYSDPPPLSFSTMKKMVE